jgi:hypothetical protein
MALLASSYCNFQSKVAAYLRNRHRNIATPAEDLPKCQVTTGLLIALHTTGLKGNEFLDVVIALDIHPWIVIPDTSMVSLEEQAVAVKRCRAKLSSRINDTLRKVTNARGLGAGKDRAKMLFGGDPADISKCLNVVVTRFSPTDTAI